MVKKRLSDLLREEVNKDKNQPDAKPDAEQAADTSAKLAEPPAQSDAETAEPPSSNAPQNDTALPKANAKKASPKAEPAKTPPEPIVPSSAEPSLGEPLRLGVHPSQQSSDQPPQETAVEPNPVSSKRTSPTKADLESTIAQLKKQLEAAQQQSQQETQLTEQVDRLQAEVKRQQSLIDQLQAEIQHSKSLKAELEEARQVILKLSEINAKPVDVKYGSLDTSKPTSPATQRISSSTARPPANGAAPSASQPPSQPPSQLANHHLYVKAGESKPIDPPAARPTTSRSGAPIVPAPSNAAEPELESKPVQLKMPGANSDAGKLAPPARHQQELRRILDHPVRPGALPPMPTPSAEDKKEDKKLSETDMGWVD